MALAPPPLEDKTPAPMARWLQQLWDHVRALPATGGGGGAPTDAEYLVTSSDATLSAERVFDLGAYTLHKRPTTTNPEDDHFNAASMDAKWSAFGSPGTPDLTSLPGWYKHDASVVVDSGWTQAAPAGDWTLEGEFLIADDVGASPATVPHIAGVMFTDSANRAASNMWWLWAGKKNAGPSSSAYYLACQYFVNGAFSSGLINVDPYPDAAGSIFLRLMKSGSTFQPAVSSTGLTWQALTVPTALGFTPTRIGVYFWRGGHLCNYFVRR